MARPGIIPARAGFTGRTSDRIWCRGDHPRSRGVYYTERGDDKVQEGSSPLARGLHTADRPGRGAVRIIPARAGFTRRPSTSTLRDRDHPRSRGVYARACLGAVSAAGSSPLARGLPLAAIEDQVHDRIIPARAGFTCQPHWGHTPYPDHPRSRGVYPIGHRLHRGLDGSSPLARGLPRIQSGAGYLPRIIPARAGFTTGLRIVEASLQDHPRSRGVYLSMERFSIKTSGSSPLARGLRPRQARPRPVGRIIPARAGFTATAPAAEGRARDHPRSRGVYLCLVLDAREPRGSSPLARGLRGASNDDVILLRIIPARAGFTWCK